MNFEYINMLREKAGISIDISEYHGKISSLLCCGNHSSETLLPLDINLEKNSFSPKIMKFRTVLLTVIEETREELNDDDMKFYPLLSPDSGSLIDRTLSLSSWCQGFIDGFAFIIAKKNISVDAVEQDIIGEIIEDFSQISKLTSASIMNENGEELAYMEVVEYVRVGAQLIFEEMKVVKT